MNSTKQAALRRSALWLNGALALAFIVCHAEPARSQQWTTSGNNISNTNTGNVGIGTTTPTAKLDVAGSVRARDGFRFSDGSRLTVSGDGELVRLSADGTPLPAGWGAQPESLAGALADTAVDGNIVFTNPGTPNYARDIRLSDNLGGVRIFGAPSMTSSPAGAALQFFGNGHSSFPGQAYVDAGAHNSAAVIFRSAPTGGTIAERMRVTSAGDVGIGTTTPTAKLDVAGNLNASGTITAGNIAAKYQDVAEWVPTREKLAAGTVVVLDTTVSNHVVASTSAYDTGVAGVVSEQPGIILGEGGEGKVKVATTGRVKVRVDATRAPVKIGDLLVTGDGPGVAMKSEPVTVGGRRLHAPGTIVGKALEPLEKGVGEILVLLSLQ